MSLLCESTVSNEINRGWSRGPVLASGNPGHIWEGSLLTSMVGVSMRARVIMAVEVQGHIVLAHQVHDLQHAHAMQDVQT